MFNEKRFTPASIEAFKRTARDVQRAYPLGLQEAQEILARTYGYPDLHALQEHLKTSPPDGPYPSGRPGYPGFVRPFIPFGRFDRFTNAVPLGRFSIVDLHVFDEPRVRKQAMDDNALGGSYIHYYLHNDTLQTRHCRLTWSESHLLYHAGFTKEDQRQGWTVAERDLIVGATSEDIAAAERRVVSDARQYWISLHEECSSNRVVHDRHHYVMHELAHGQGFGGAAFEVSWLDGRPPTICNLSSQGRVPAWITHLIPDNGRVRELSYREGRRLSPPKA